MQTKMAQKLLNSLSTFFLACLSFVVLGFDPGLNHQPHVCNRERIVLTGKYGIITNGNEYYKDSHCEWLIKAPDEHFSISLTFTKMDTECSYDHVFIYDGESYSSPILGSFSGNTTPSSVTATHGSMLILLYSDTNYIRSGFEAVFHVTDCPLNCSNNGVCQNHQCLCQPLWSGSACEVSLCPNDCGNFEGHGECDLNGSYPIQCRCKSGYSGMDCSLPDSNKNSGNTWHLISSMGISPRAAHIGVYVEKVDSFFVFGGYSFRKVLGDSLLYSFEKNRWRNVSTPVSPQARYAHAAVSYSDSVIMYGGELENSSLSSELWIFNVSSLTWKICDIESSFIPPPLARHSATLVDSQWLYIIGGSLSDDTISSKMYRINIHKKKWELLETYGDKDINRRLVGHSAVYYEPTKTIFVFGGITAEYSHVSKLSNVMHAFHVEKRYWIKIKYQRNVFAPLERAFHSAAIIGDYMVIYGGYTHKHVEEEICYDNETHLYHLRCHKWVDFSTLKGDFAGPKNPISQGVFSHAMGVRHGHTLLISGGYSGNMRSEFLAYVMPSVIYSDQLIINSCSRHKRMESCLSNLACGWCFENDLCIERKNSKTCSKFSAETCPGFCSALSDCVSCMIWGQSFIQNDISDRQDQFPAVPCAWCVQDFKCHAVNDGDNSCSSSNASASVSSTSRTHGWWGPRGTDILDIKDCYIKDSPPGLISVQYRFPVNWSQPDDVTYLLQASEDLFFRPEMARNDSNGIEENIVKFLGFLHPLNAKPLSERVKNLKLAICSAGSSAILKLSNDSTPNHLESVASHGPRTSFDCLEAQRTRGAPLFPHVNDGQKYMFEFTVKIPHYNETSQVQLKWTAFSVELEVIPYKYLELYKNGSCYLLNNCLSCLTDALCGWCENTDTCYLKSNSSSACQNSDGNSFLVTQPSSCTVCSDYIYCEQCTQVPHCEWLVESAVCVRKGRYNYAVKSPVFCPVPCHLRSSCSSCLGDPGVCAWCEETQTCFPFSVYTSIYSYGKCRDWVDENRVENSNPVLLCRNCSRHSNCSTCIKDLTCGWCSYAKHPLDGLCIEGDFSGPYSGICPPFRKNETTEILDSQWLYGMCPDLDECYWDLHNCHKNATCKNTLESFVCECNVGFQGNGTDCTRACAMKCIHGNCSAAHDYKCICNLGWTGEDCNTNCGCNNHSTCIEGVGLCDACQNWTEGQFCEKCKDGSFAFTHETKGCQQCNCNGHGDMELGFCNKTTGSCFCLNHTTGPNCEKCIEGYYGDPRNDGECFEVCSPRKVITNATEGKFGSPAGSQHARDCLWLLTVHSVLDMQSLLGPMERTGSYLQITIHKDIHIPCPHNHLYIYDGLPNFVASGHPNVLLGAFCGSNLTHPIIATAASGYLTVHFKRDAPSHGFNASYVRLQKESLNESSEYCLENTTLVENVTICLRNFCPNDCYNFLSQGYCDKVYHICICQEGYGGDDCSIKLKSYNLVWSMLYSYKKLTLNDSTVHLPSGRIGHSLLSVKNKTSGLEDLWLFGGHSPSFGYLDDLFFYNMSSHQWNKIKYTSDYVPTPRFFHASASLNNSLYVFGGIDEATSLGDFWEFNTLNHTWIQLPNILISSETLVLSGSTLTSVNDHKLVLIGGYSPNYGFLDKVLEFDTESKQWTVLNVTGAMPLGLYGHSSVFHASTHSIYVFGGVSYETSVSPSNHLYAFNYISSQWSRLPPDMKVNSVKNQPLPRYFHASVVTDDYIVIIGGRGRRTTKDSQPFAYVFSCNLWIPLKDAAIQVVGKWPEPVVGASMAIANGNIFFFGNPDGELFKLTLPVDICNLFSANRVGCIQQTGCAFCSLENEENQTICYAQHKRSESRCYNPSESKQFFSVTCNEEWLERRDCHQYKTCTDCIASWPFYLHAKQSCRWCSSCQLGGCAPADTSCKDGECNIQKEVIEDPSVCPLRECFATDCKKCISQDKCSWTRHVLRSVGYAHTLNKNPAYNWGCIMNGILSAATFPVEAMPPLNCPKPCEEYADCMSCLNSDGGEGGWHQCVWSETRQSCMSPTFELIRCEDGSCGPVLHSNKSLCSTPCSQHFQASHCLSQAHCGWCAFSGPKVDGLGLCMNGGIMGPTGGICRENRVILLGLPLPSQTIQWYELSEGAPTWNYLTKPPENECANGHHNCDDSHEECVDTLDGFECHCKPGYKMIRKICTPICRQGCFNGSCIQPDVCKCNFGYVGRNCSIMCKCNGHSHCPGIDQLDVCLECLNNTMGSHCEKCKPYFVGNPANGGKCVSCHDYCHTHSTTCISSELLNSTYSQSVNQSFIYELLEKVTEGSSDEAICLDCKNHTEGKRCDQCISGFFKAGETLEDGCRPCECHGHGDTCNPLNGENCNCQNNTENDRQCSQKNTKNIMHLTPCWQLQCSKCKEYFLGTPSHGHQCYRHMFLDKDYCFNPGTIEECNRNPSPLLQGHTGFFAVQPRYMNVDIRIIVDVTKGGVDFFLAAKDDVFIVEVDKETGLHDIYIDEKYGINLKSHKITADTLSTVKRKRNIEELRESSNSTEPVSSEVLLPTFADAQGLTTYIEVKKCEDFLLVRNLENRLVVTIPQEVHDLRTTRFYMILRGTKEETLGNLFFRQDQTRIDLFVFFSVFFSCFFLFLAICVVVWKVKQAFDLRRARRLHAAEMKHMASRPFGRIITIVDDDMEDSDLYLYSPSNYRKKMKHIKTHGRDSPKQQAEDKTCLRPLAVEPLSDGFGAIATILVQLPGGAQSLVRMSLASTLITARSSPYHLGFGLRAAMRRRTSHANV